MKLGLYFLSSLCNVFPGLLVVGAISWLVGCSAVEVYDESRYLYAGERLPPAVFSNVKPAVTSQNWVLDYIGEPTEKYVLANGDEHWIYPLLIEHVSGGRIVLLYSGMSVEQESRYFHLLLRNGVVDKLWYTTPTSSFQSTAPVVVNQKADNSKKLMMSAEGYSASGKDSDNPSVMSSDIASSDGSDAAEDASNVTPGMVLEQADPPKTAIPQDHEPSFDHAKAGRKH